MKVSQRIILFLFLLAAGCSRPGTGIPTPTPLPPTPVLQPSQAHPTATPAPADPVPHSGLIYQTEEGLFQVTAQGSARRLIGRPDAVLSPDLTQALYTDQGELWLADLARGKQRVLTHTPQWIEFIPRWWPARPEMILCRIWPADTAPDPRTGHLALLRLDGTDYRIIDAEHATATDPAGSPDGRTLAYDRDGVPMLYDLESRTTEPLDPEQYGQADLPIERFGSPAWSPDGNQLAWIYRTQEKETGLAIFDLEQHTLRLPAAYSPARPDDWPPTPVWSPDGRWLALLREARDPAETGLWIIRIDGSGERRLASRPEARPLWSPDSRNLAWIVDDALQMVEIETGATRSVELPSGAWPVRWPAPAP